MHNKNRRIMGYLFLLPAMLLFLIFIAYPVFNTIRTSFYSVRIQTLASGGKFVGLSNYIKLFNDDTMWKTLTFTVEFTVIAVVLETVLGMACALLMNRKFRGDGFVKAAILVPWCIPTVVSGMMWAYMFAESYGIVNQSLLNIGAISSAINWMTNSVAAFWAIVIADVWKTTPYMGLLLLSGLKTVPEDLYEAAAIDGAGKIRRFFRITLPIIKPVIIVAIMFRTISSFRIYDLIKVMTGGGPNKTTMSLTMYTMQQYFSFGDLGYGAALAVLTFIISLVIAFIFYDGMKSKLEVK